MTARSPYPTNSMHGSHVSFLAAVVGNGTGAPTIPASTVVPPQDNWALSAVRTSEGLYVITLKDRWPLILNVVPTIVAATGAFKQAYPVSWNEVAGTITIQVMLAAGSGVDDLESTDTLRLWVEARTETY